MPFGSARSFRGALARRLAAGGFLLVGLIGLTSVLALRSILRRQLDGTLLHLAEVEAQAGAATAGPEFQFHEGVLMGAGEGTTAELIRFAELWTSEGLPVVRSRNLPVDLDLPPGALSVARAGRPGWASHAWQGRPMRSVVYPLSLVGAAHHIHLLQVAAPLDPIRQTLTRFAGFLALLAVGTAAVIYALAWRVADLALRPTREITQQAEAISAGTLSERITAHAGVAEFARLVTVLNSMLDRLDRAFVLQRQFTADASHELRAPLTALKGDIDVTLKRPRTADEYRQALERSRGDVDRLARLAGDLLTLARTDAALPLEGPTEVDLREMADRVAARQRPVAAGRGVTISVTGPATPVMGDPLVLERVVGNLVENAVRHGREGGTVHVEVAAGGDAALVVRDDGQGISPEHAPHVFDRFYRADPARRAEGGTGLGLAIARAGALAHGGTLAFEGNRPGAVFRLTLPSAPATGSTPPGSPPG